MRLTLSAVLVLFLSACPKPTPGGDGGTGGGAGQAPELTSVSPSRGPLSGGTTVSLQGANLLDGAQVTFGDRAGTQVVVTTRRSLTVRTPAGGAVGPVDVTVTNPDGQRASLAAAFTYEADPVRAIEDARVVNPADELRETSASPVAVTIVGQVTVPGVTTGAGQGPGVKGQVGFAVALSSPPVPADFTWSDAAWAGDVDGPSLGDQLRDAYQADVQLPGATGDQEKSYWLAVRFSLDDGATWTFADRDGHQNGVDAAQLPRVRLRRPGVTWCKLGGELVEAPPAIAQKTTAPALVVYGQVYHQGVTDQSGAGTGVEGALGYGSPGTDPAGFTWVAAAFNRDTNAGANDEYQASLPVLGTGTYEFAYRFRVNGGPWSLCDADGLANGGFTHAQAGQLTVTPIGIDWCTLQYPSVLSAREGASTEWMYARVFAETITEAASPGPGVAVDFGYGPTGVAPTDPAWSWTAAAYNLEVSGGAEEWMARFTAPAPGAFAFAARARYQGGANVLCDLDGSGNGYDAAQAGAFTSVSNGVGVTSCKLQYVEKSSAGSGDAVLAYGRVLVTGQTSLPGRLAGLRAQLGVGTQGDDASASTSWGWADALYNVEVSATGEEEYAVALHPAYSGTRAVTFRVSVDDGASWTYCDLDGSGNGYSASQQHALAVGNPSDIDYCALKFPTTLTQPADGGTVVYGQLYVPGVTPNSGADPSIRAELGYGPKAEDPGVASSWTWIPANYNAGCTTCGSNNDEYEATLARPGGLPSGTLHYAFRFSRSGSLNACYGDLNGAGSTTGGFNGEDGPNENLGVATITP